MYLEATEEYTASKIEKKTVRLREREEMIKYTNRQSTNVHLHDEKPLVIYTRYDI